MPLRVASVCLRLPLQTTDLFVVFESLKIALRDSFPSQLLCRKLNSFSLSTESFFINNNTTVQRLLLSAAWADVGTLMSNLLIE